MHFGNKFPLLHICCWGGGLLISILSWGALRSRQGTAQLLRAQVVGHPSRIPSGKGLRETWKKCHGPFLLGSSVLPCCAAFHSARISKPRARKRAQRLTFWARRLPGRVGGSSTRRGRGAVRKVRSLPQKSVLLGFRNLGCSMNFAGMSRTRGVVHKVCARKVRAHVSAPKTRCLGNPWFAPRIPVVFVISVVSVISADPALKSLFASV